MIKILPLEAIMDPTFREAYAKLVEFYQRRKDSKLVETLCHQAKFNPVSFLVHFHKYRTFTVFQIGFIADLYQRYEAHHRANERYTADGHREEFTRLLQDILDHLPIPTTRKAQGAKGSLAQRLRELKDGQLVFSRYLSINPDLLDLLPADRKEGFVERLETLTSAYWELFREESAKLTLDHIR